MKEGWEQLDEQQLAQGYFFDRQKECWVCLDCLKEFDRQEIFAFDGKFYTAQKADRKAGTAARAVCSRDDRCTDCKGVWCFCLNGAPPALCLSGAGKVGKTLPCGVADGTAGSGAVRQRRRID